MSTRGAYRFSEWPSGGPVPGSCATIDAAIEEARKLSKGTTQGVSVVDTTQSPPKIRGVADKGLWRWMARCSPCSGTGEQEKCGSKQSCPNCHGRGIRPDDSLTGVR